MITPFINFAGKCKEALDFYETVFNAKDKHIMYFKDAPPNPDFVVTEQMQDYVLYAEMTITGTKVSFSDTQSNVVPGNMISLGVNLATEAEVRLIFDRLKEGGEVLMELAPQFYSPLYGWVKDKFGIGWQVICQ